MYCCYVFSVYGETTKLFSTFQPAAIALRALIPSNVPSTIATYQLPHVESKSLNGTFVHCYIFSVCVTK